MTMFGKTQFFLFLESGRGKTVATFAFETPKEPQITDTLRIAIVSESSLSAVNGVTNSVYRVLDHVSERGHQAMVYCPGPAPDHYKDFPVITSPAINVRGYQVGITTDRIAGSVLRKFKPDVVHVAAPFGPLGASALKAAKRLDVPSVAAYQTDIPRYAIRNHVAMLAPLAVARLVWVHGLADLTIAPSKAAIGDLERYGIPKVKIAHWGRGVDAVRFNPDRRTSKAVQTLREELAPNGEVIVGYVGRLAPEKRVERLAALGGLPNTRLVIVGDGPSRQSVSHAVKDSAMLGQLSGDDLANAYATFDIFAHTGTEETFGQTLQEAMATGLPVVAPAAGGPLDIVKSGFSGILYEAESDEALREAVAILAQNPDARTAMGELGRSLVLPRSWSALGDQLIELYRRTKMQHIAKAAGYLAVKKVA